MPPNLLFPNGRSYRPDIDGLRSIAILSVVIYHAGLHWLPGGFTGVDIFFVISGYLIGGHIYVDLLRGRFRYATFYQRRAKRILPALYVVLVVTLAIGLALLSPEEFRQLAGYAGAATASASNIALWWKASYYFKAGQNPLLMTWSLGVEEQFYLVIPLLMVLLVRLRRRLILPMVGLVSVISFALAWYQQRRSPAANFYLLDSRAWELAAGIGLAIFEVNASRLLLQKRGAASNAAGWVGLILMLAPLGLLSASTPFPGPAALPSIAGSALLLASNGSWINRRLLSLPPLVFIGRISYSWYLWHWPILSFLRLVYGNPLPPGLALAAIALTFGLAVLSYYGVEQRFRSSRRAPAPLLLRYGVVSLLLLATCGFIFRANGLAARYPAVAPLDRAELRVLRDPCLASDGERAPRLTARCAGAATAAKRMAVWGDSHAAALAPALRVLGAQQGYGFQQYTKSDCAPLLGAAFYEVMGSAHADECIAFNNAVMQRLQADPQTSVVVLEGWWESLYQPGVRQLLEKGEAPHEKPSEAESERVLAISLRRTISALQATGKRVVVMGDVPDFAVDPLWRMRTSRIPLRYKLHKILGGPSGPVDPGSDWASDEEQPQRDLRRTVRDTALSVPGVAFWNLRIQLCARTDICLYRDGDHPLYIDTNHVTLDGGEKALQGWAVPAFGGT